ncbi:MAG: fatty acid desaturase [Microcoleaceae cyanobacterium]
MTSSTLRPDQDAAANFNLADLRLKHILKTLPPECFQRNRLKAWTAVLFSGLAVVIGYVSIVLAPWYLLPLAWAFTGTAATGLFVIGHDCGHRSFAKRKWVNNLVGHMMMLPLIYPFHCWRILHNHHHLHTNKLDVDNAWHPFQTDFYEGIGRFKQVLYHGFRSWFWWVASTVHWAVLHFDLNQFSEDERPKAKFSIAVVVIFALVAFPTLIATTGWWGFVKFWLMPWLGYHFWMSTFTLVHHTAIDIPFKPAESWNETVAQLEGSVHCDYPRWVEALCHDINVHIPHHISTAIPSYNLRMAHRSLQLHWGSHLKERTFSWALIREIVEHCHFYDEQFGYRSFDKQHLQGNQK